MSTFERLTLSEYDDGPCPWPADVYRTALKAAYAEIDRLRANALEWVTVTDDPVTLPDMRRPVLLQHYDLDMIVAWRQEDGTWGTPYTGHCEEEGMYDVVWPIEPGDRWAYIPND